jgi:DNA-binding transcriptional ArsR family regulator
VSEDLSDARVIKALGHATRRSILLEFDKGGASPKEIASRLGVPLANVSYHVKILRDLGLVELTGTTPRRGAVEHHYVAVLRPKLTPKRAAGLPALARNAVAREAWSDLAAAVRDSEAMVQVRQLKVDPKGREDLLAALDKLWAAVDSIESASEKRLIRKPDQADAITLGLVAASPRAAARGRTASRSVKAPPRYF